MTAFTWGDRVSSDDDSLDRYLHDGTLVPKSPSAGALLWAAEWLSTYQSENPEDLQDLANVVGLLVATAEAKERRAAVTAAKRAYAKEHGIPVSRVRVAKRSHAGTEA